MRLSVRPGGNVILTAPVRVSEAEIEKFFDTHTSWIKKALAKMSRFKPLPVSGRRAYLAHKEDARTFINGRVAYWNGFYDFRHGRIAIKNTSAIWGSCSRRGNLNFSYSLLFLPRQLADYVIVHELCHLREHNHSAAFWTLVGRSLPNYAALKKELRLYVLKR